VVIRSKPQSSGQILVSVQDSGIGVSPEVKNRLFEPFFTTRSNGMGMGLSISRSIIEAHGGRLWAESDGSTGSVFHFTLPSELAV
jgi:signal transduction histidine kinase